MAAGGTAGQVLSKKSTTDYDTEWTAPPVSGVSSVDGRTGAVTLGDLYVDVAGDNMTGNLGLGVPSPTAKVHFAAATNAAGGIAFGADTNLYRSAADTLKTDDSLHVATNLGVGTVPDTNYRGWLRQNTTHTTGVGAWSLYAQQNWTGTDDCTAYISAGVARIYTDLAAGKTLTNGAVEGIAALSGIVQLGGDGTYATSTAGVLGYIVKTGTGNANLVRAFVARSPNMVAGTVNSSVGLDLNAQKVTGVTTGYGIYQRGATDLNYFAGSVTLGGSASSVIGFYGAAGTTRPTGWAAATGTATRTTFATGTATVTQLAERLKALTDDLIALGLIGA